MKIKKNNNNIFFFRRKCFFCDLYDFFLKENFRYGLGKFCIFILVLIVVLII